jgi:dienelactone hydrolase
MRRIALAALVAAGLVGAPAARAADLSPLTYSAREAVDHLYADGRGIDQQSNPAYIRRTAPEIITYFQSGDPAILVDPFRQSWNGTRGISVPISFINRYGARLVGHLWRAKAPVTAPLPAVLVLPGFGGDDVAFTGLIEQLAESGYVVLSVVPQGSPGSDTEPNPKSTYCDPNGAWREPQEAGISEQGPCAGEDPPGTAEGDPTLNRLLAPLADTPAGALTSLAAQAPLLVMAHTDPKGTLNGIAPEYESFRPRFVFAALDAVKWLRSDENPWRALVDIDHVGLVGHSAGSDGAVVAANGDPLHRFAAAVGWDTYGDPPPGMLPTVPTMLQQSEQENLMGPFPTPPDPELFHSYRIFHAFEAALVDAMEVALRGSTHQEWTYIPYSLANPLAPLTDASARGQEVAAYYTLAWLDRYLKPAMASDATRRLTARVFDDSSDRSSIGSGTWDALQQRNVPYHLSGDLTADLLSWKFRSEYAFGGLSCADLQSGCPAAKPTPIADILSGLTR